MPSELAATTAAAVLDAGRNGGATGADIESLVHLADNVGLDTLRALWRGAEPVSVANSLWMLYLLRSWCATDAAGIGRLWSLGEPLAPADAVVAGLNPLGDEAAIIGLADAILTGAFRGDFAVALERAASVFRVLAAGRRVLGAGDIDRADRNDRAATALATAARRWRAGTLR